MNVSDNEVVKLEYVPNFLRHSKSRLWLSGHSHAFERFSVNGRRFVVAGGGGAPRHKLMADDELRHAHVGRPRSGRMVSPFHSLVLRRLADSVDLQVVPVKVYE